MNILKQSTAATIKLGAFVDDTDGKTAETGLTISQADIRLSKNGGDFAQTNNATGATHDELGYYNVPLDATDTNTLGRLLVAVHESGALPVWKEFLVVTANVYDTLCSTDTFDVNVTSLADDVITAGKFDESTAFPLKSADTGTTQVARVGADSDTLETLSDEIAAVKAETAAILADTGTDGVVLAGTQGAITWAQQKIVANVSGQGALDIANSHSTGYGLHNEGNVAQYNEGVSIGLYNSAFNQFGKTAVGMHNIGLLGQAMGIDYNASGIQNEYSALVGSTYGGQSGNVKGFDPDIATAAALTTVDNEVGVIDGIVDAIKAKTDNLPADPADDSDIDAQLAAIKAETALIVEDTGTTIPATLADLALEATLTAIKGAGWTDQTLAALMTAIEAVSGGSGATAQEVWEYTTRVLTAGTNIDLSGLAPAGEYDAELTAIQADLDNPAQYKADVSALATTAHVQEVEDKIDVIDNVADAIKVKTDQLTFTVAGSVDATATADISGIAGDVWSHANRTLTNQGTSVTSPAEGDPLEIYRDTTVYITLTGIGATTGYTKIWFTVKEDLEDADTDAILQIDTTDKLKYIDGEAGTSTDGLLVIDSEEETADITLLQASARLLPVYTAYPAFWDLKMLNDGVVSLLSTGEIYIYSTPTRSIS